MHAGETRKIVEAPATAVTEGRADNTQLATVGAAAPRSIRESGPKGGRAGGRSDARPSTSSFH